MVTTLASLKAQLAELDERRRAYEALPWYRRAVALTKQRANSVSVHWHFQKLRVKKRRPWETRKFIGSVLRAIFLQRYQ